MEGITLKETASTFQIILDKKFFSAKQIKEIVSWLQTEFVIKKINNNKNL